MDSKLVYDTWCKNVQDPELSLELAEMSLDDISIKFGSSLKFGTAGARALMSAGSCRINVVTIAHIAYAFAIYLIKNFTSPSVAISCDTRKYSRKFAEISSQVLASMGVKVYFFDSPQPIGMLSFAIRNLKCSGGVMITASHNPPEYNGFKVYNSLGAQPINTDEISKNLSSTDVFDINYEKFDFYLKNNQILLVDENLKEKYITDLKSKINLKYIDDIDIVYSPLNGCARELFCKLFDGFNNLHIVPEQMYPDESFSSCKRPDPQSVDAFKLSISLAEKYKSDVIILNDPDGDRLGIAVRYNDEYKILSGIEIGALLLNYVAQTRKSSNLISVKSIVTGGLSKSIADFYKIKLFEVLPGFKYISDFMHNLENQNLLDSFALGFEESNGFLLNSSVRDKDGISSSAFFCEMISFYKDQKLNCIDVLNSLYEKFGYHMQKNISFQQDDMSKIDESISNFKKYFVSNSDDVISVTDYRISEKINKDGSSEKIDLPSSNMLQVEFKNDNSLFVRSSGTEPLMKIYILYNGKSKQEALKNCERIEKLLAFV